MTDWGAHHVDIAAWAFNLENTGPVKIEPVMAKHPVPLKDGMPTDPSQYNTATEFHVKATFANGAVLHIRDTAKDLGFDNGLMLEGTTGRIFVNRGKLTGEAVDALKTDPLRRDAFKALQRQTARQSHEELLRVHCGQDTAYQRRPQPSPGNDRLSPREHRHSAGAHHQLGSRSGANCRRFRSRTLAGPRTTQGIRSQGLKDVT